MGKPLAVSPADLFPQGATWVPSEREPRTPQPALRSRLFFRFPFEIFHMLKVRAAPGGLLVGDESSTK